MVYSVEGEECRPAAASQRRYKHIDSNMLIKRRRFVIKVYP